MNPEDSQLSLQLRSGNNHKSIASQELESNWLGLAIDHRRLLDALQDGWLRPLQEYGFLVGLENYVSERDMVSTGYLIPIHIKMDPTKLPFLDVRIQREEHWVKSNLDGVKSGDRMLYWPGALPTFAISEVAVPTEEERVRLIGMARHVSNVNLPEIVVTAGSKCQGGVEPNISPPELLARFEIPSSEDAIRGAMSMAVWGVPRIDPWLDVLAASLDSNSTPDLQSAAVAVEATWWRFPPWVQRSSDMQPSDLQECLWLAAVDVFYNQVDKGIDGYELTDKIAQEASHFGCVKMPNTISEWRKNTLSFLRAETTVQLSEWRTCPVGIAIQLVLARPEPTIFKTWFKDLPGLSPAVAWSAATLCGLLHGYRKLDTQFRGDELQREFLSIYALRACEGAPDIDWRRNPTEGLELCKEDDAFAMSWGGREIFRKGKKSRGRWLVANFDDEKVRQQAEKEAQRLNWPCIHSEIYLSDVQCSLFGSGKVRLQTQPDCQLEIKGERRMRLPVDTRIENSLDIESFRHQVSIAPGPISDPPASQFLSPQAQQTEVPGLVYVPNFLSEREEQKLVDIIDKNDWNNYENLQRRVQHYGWRYDYKARRS